MAAYKVGYFVGSLSSKSINRLLAKALGRLAPPELVLTEIPIKDLPLRSTAPTSMLTTRQWRARSSSPSPMSTQCSSLRPNTTARSPAG